MATENDIDIQTFEVSLDEPDNQRNAIKNNKVKPTKKANIGGLSLPKSLPSFSSSSKTKKSSRSSYNSAGFLEKINATHAIIIGVTIVVLFIAYDIITTI